MKTLDLNIWLYLNTDIRNEDVGTLKCRDQTKTPTLIQGTLDTNIA